MPGVLEVIDKSDNAFIASVCSDRANDERKETECVQ